VKEVDVVWVLFSLGYLYSDWGKLDETEKIYQLALQGREKI